MVDPISFGGSLWSERNEDRGFPEWHRGRPWYYFWAVMVDDARWQRNVEAAAQALAGYLVPDYQRQPHITLLPAGFPSADKVRIDKLTDIARVAGKFEIALGSLTSFSSSPCYGLERGVEALRGLRIQLRRVMFDENSVVSDVDYQPHVTVGLYRDRFPAKELRDRLTSMEPAAARSIQVTEFVLARYHTASIKGPIQVVAKLALESGRFTSIQESEVFA